VEMAWKGSLNENDPAQQMQILEQFVSEGVGGIVLAPIDDTALKRPVATAKQKGIPVMMIDSALKGEPVKDFVSTVSTNNYRGGEMAGEQLGKLLDGKGKVVLFRFKEGSANTGQREVARSNQEDFRTFRLFSTIATPARPPEKLDRPR
jgi:ribose transport system substrate-binding protein